MFGTGVDLFFVISGFVFAQNIYKEKPISIIPYFLRRFFRIYPLYLFALVLYYIIAPSDPHKPLYFVKHLFFLQTTSSSHEASFFNPAFWSLPTEVEFYIAVPFIALLLRHYRKTVPLMFIAGMLVNMLLVHNAVMTPELNAPSFSLFHLTGILPEFIIGIGLYQAYQRYEKPSPALSTSVFLLGLMLYVLLVTFLFRHGPGEAELVKMRLTNSFFFLLCAVAYAAMIFPFLRIADGSRLPLRKACLFAGAVSYGIYVFHGLVPTVLKNVFPFPFSGARAYLIGTAVTIMLAFVCYQAVENPMRLLGRRLSEKYLRKA